MKIVSFTVKNFGCLCGENNTVRFDKSDTIFLIGKNNLGKSTFLRAYEFFIEAKSKAIQDDFHNKNASIPIEIECTYLKEDNDENDTELSKEPDWVNKWVDREGFIRVKKIWSSPNHPGEKHTYNPTSGNYEKGGFGGFDTLLTKYSPTPVFIGAVTTQEELEKQINSIITNEHIKQIKLKHADKYDEINEQLQNFTKEIADSSDISDIAKKMNEFFSSIFPNLSLKIVSSNSDFDLTKTLSSSHNVLVSNSKVRDSGESFSIRKNGDGVIRQALFSFISSYGIESESNKKQYLILFEEPELYLHPEAIFSLRDQLYSLASDSPFQVLCATHSPLMIDVSKPHSSLVRISTGIDEKTVLHQVEFDVFEKEDKEKLQMSNRFNPHVCESFFSDEVILVEGDTEAIFYRELISNQYKNETESSKRNIFILNTGSKANMVFYQKILTHFGIKHIVVHDIDSPTNDNGKANAMWTVNNKIWEQIIVSNSNEPLARRFTHNRNFEEAHSYVHISKIGKPLSAYRFALDIKKQDKLPCNEFLADLFDSGEINHSQDYVEELNKVLI